MSFAPPLPILVAYLLACFALAATPGPDMALFLQKTLNGGRPHGFAALAGAALGILAHTLAAAVGLSALIAASSRLYGALEIVGALYLLRLAWVALRRGSALKFAAGDASSPSLAQTFRTGVLINLTNPKIVMFFVTFLPQFVDAGEGAAPLRFAFLGAAFVAVAVLVNGSLILAAARVVAATHANPSAFRVFDYLVAAVMAGFAARLLISRPQ